MSRGVATPISPMLPPRRPPMTAEQRARYLQIRYERAVQRDAANLMHLQETFGPYSGLYTAAGLRPPWERMRKSTAAYTGGYRSDNRATMEELKLDQMVKMALAEGRDPFAVAAAYQVVDGVKWYGSDDGRMFRYGTRAALVVGALLVGAYFARS